MTLNVEIYSAVTINYSLSELFFHPYQLNKEICTNDKKKQGKIIVWTQFLYIKYTELEIRVLFVNFLK